MFGGKEVGAWMLVTSQERRQEAAHHHGRTQEILCMALPAKKKKNTKRITRNRTGGEMKTAQKVPCSLKIEKVGVMC